MRLMLKSKKIYIFLLFKFWKVSDVEVLVSQTSLQETQQNASLRSAAYQQQDTFYEPSDGYDVNWV